MTKKTFRPVFCFPQQLARSFFIILFFLIGPLAAGVGVLHDYAQFTLLEAFLCAFVGITALDLLLASLISHAIKACYRNACFTILEDRIEYSRDFFTVQIKDLKFKNVKEMALTQGPLQRLYGIGTILLQSHASPQQAKGGMSGLRIYSVENPKKLYAFLKKKVDEADA